MSGDMTSKQEEWETNPEVERLTSETTVFDGKKYEYDVTIRRRGLSATTTAMLKFDPDDIYDAGLAAAVRSLARKHDFANGFRQSADLA
jgi:hypothetical protein